MYPISHTIEAAKQLLLHFTEIDSKTFTFGELAKSFNVERKQIIDLHKKGLVKIENVVLNYGYITAYKNERLDTFKQIAQQRLAAMGYGRFPVAEKLKGYYDDKFCGLTEPMYRTLIEKKVVPVSLYDLESLYDEQISPLSHCNFNISIDKEGLEKYLSDFIKKFQTDEIDDSSSNRYLSYKSQKESVTVAIKKLTNAGQPANSLKIDCTQIWPTKYDMLNVHFLETFLGMEEEGLFKILSIKYTFNPLSSVVMTSDDFWDYPQIIKIKLADKFLNPGGKKSFPSLGVYFDKSDGILSYNGQSAQLVKIGTKEHFLLKTLFDVSKLGEWLNEQDIEEAYSRGDIKNFRWIKDAILRLNQKIDTKFGLKVFFERGGSKIRINPNYLS